MTKKHAVFMRRAIDLAEKGRGGVGTNPLVGTVVVRGGRIVGRGWHSRFGEPHAEAIALSQAGERAKGADLYVTMEPCSGTGKTPPCTRMIIAAGIKRVVYACCDPHEKGKGLKDVRKHGIKVVGGVMEREAGEQNIEYFTRGETCRPFLTLKLAITMDGRTRDGRGRSKWITSPTARAWTRGMRGRVDAIMVGTGTVLADDPRLTAPAGGSQPLKIIVDGNGRTPPSARLLRSGMTLIAATGRAPKARLRALRARGAEIMTVGLRKREVNLSELMRALFRRGVGSILCEGGATLAGALIAQGLVDRAVTVIAPKLMGNRPVAMCLGLGAPKTIRIGPDLAVLADRVVPIMHSRCFPA